MRVSLNQSLRTDRALDVGLGTHQHEALLENDIHDQKSWLFDKKPSTKQR